MPAVRTAAFVLLVSLLATNADAQRAAAAAASPFDGLAGPWTGSGVITFLGGARERVRCRADYTVSRDRENLRQNLRCASDSYKFELSSDVYHRNGEISGRWSESTRNFSGTIAGSVSGAHIAVWIISDIFAALVGVTTHGNNQRVIIRSPGSKFEEVNITLRRRR